MLKRADYILSTLFFVFTMILAVDVFATGAGSRDPLEESYLLVPEDLIEDKEIFNSILIKLEDSTKITNADEPLSAIKIPVELH